jgi:hypothetical protein
MPIHWNELWSPAASPNEVTTDQADATSRQPALKACAVCVSPVSADKVRTSHQEEAIEIISEWSETISG